MSDAESNREVRRLDELTFRGNVGSTRHGLLRLTPAYSVKLVRDLLRQPSPSGRVLDPFCGTGTTVLACAELGLECTTIDLNPFLVWFARTKIARYSATDVAGAFELVARMTRAARSSSGEVLVPTIHRIDRWWDPSVASALGRAHAAARRSKSSFTKKSRDLASIAFCRTVIESANVSFGHQSMSFRKGSTEPALSRERSAAVRISRSLDQALSTVVGAIRAALPRSDTRVLAGDSRDVGGVVGGARFARVVTSPPYPNRMSYVRELRPYMYWLGYLTERKDAGELDWQAIGGTWGAATSRLGRWRRDARVDVPFPAFETLARRIERHEPLLARYVERYFEDMTHHTRHLARVMIPGGKVQYVVGNSKFYDVLLPAQEIYAALFERAGFTKTKIVVLRKRTSKRELFEYLVEAEMPRSPGSGG